MGPEFVRGPGQHRVPMRGFARDQRLGMAGAIEQQIRAEIFCDIVGHGIDAVGDLGDAVGKARQRHGQGIDGLALRIPFGGDRFRDGADRRDDLAAGRRADRLAVQRDGKPAIRRARCRPPCRTACAGACAWRVAPPPPDRAENVRRLHRIVHASRVRLPAGGDKFRPDNTIMVDANKADEEVAATSCDAGSGGNRRYRAPPTIRVSDRSPFPRGSCRRPWRGW